MKLSIKLLIVALLLIGAAFAASAQTYWSYGAPVRIRPAYSDARQAPDCTFREISRVTTHPSKTTRER